MTTTTLTAREYQALAVRERDLAAAIRTYEQPMDDTFRAFVLERGGQAGLDALVEQSAIFLAEKRAERDAILPAIRAYEANACTRCSGTGDYHGPTSHFSKGRPVCFACKGSGQRR